MNAMAMVDRRAVIAKVCRPAPLDPTRSLCYARLSLRHRGAKPLTRAATALPGANSLEDQI
jgi:hypothetical protein